MGQPENPIHDRHVKTKPAKKSKEVEVKPEELAERLDKCFDNRPKDNVELLPKDLEDAFDEKVVSKAEGFQLLSQTKYTPKEALCGAIGQAFWAGHNYHKEHGELKG